jgi:S-DNA-T family DNA segregation ATPase FtsK/SpoIIIE
MFWKKNAKSMVKSQPEGPHYKREIFTIILCAAFIFLMIAFISYNPHDNTLFHYANKYDRTTNWAGVVGAQCAAIFFFLFGSAAFIFLICMGVFAWLLFTGVPLRQERGRIVALLLLILASPTLCSALRFDLIGSVAGGFIGTWLARFLAIAFGPQGVLVFLFTVLWVGIIMLIRMPLMPLFKFFGRLLVRGLVAGWSLLRDAGALVWHKVWRSKRKTAAPAASAPGAAAQDAVAKDLAFWGSVTDGQAKVGQTVGVGQVLPDHVVPGQVAAALASAAGERWSLMHVRSASEPQRMLKGYVYRLPNSTIKKNLWAKRSDMQPSIADMVAAAAAATTVAYTLPNADFFAISHEKKPIAGLAQEVAARAKLLEQKLLHFGVKGKVTAVKTGPLITLFEYKPEIDSKISKITALEDDLAMALTATSIRILAPMPGKDVVGFEIANAVRQDVYFADVLASKEFRNIKAMLPLVFGVDVVGEPVVQDLVHMPHLLVGGATGAGKSVGLNAMIAGLLNVLTPDQLKLILIDPKRLEFVSYTDIPHLIFPIVTEPARASAVLTWVCQEMEERYETMAKASVRNVQEYHRLFEDGNIPSDRDGNRLPRMPFLVVVIDELADLMMVAGREVETALVRIAQMARAAGIHMIVATQRPSVDVVTGLIKVNFPSRIAFRVSSKVDSRTILDVQGAERLLGRGDMLYLNASSPDVVRIHGAYVADKEIHRLADWWRDQQDPTYLNLHEVLRATSDQRPEDYHDELYKEVLEFVKTSDEVSISMIQRYFRIGFNRSARLIEKLELDGIIAPAQGAKPRKVLR